MRFATLTFALTKPTIIKCSTIKRLVINMICKFDKWLFKRFSMSRKVVVYHLRDETLVSKAKFMMSNFDNDDTSSNIKQEIDLVTGRILSL